MLSLHIAFRNLVSVPILLITLISCAKRSKADLEVIKALEQSLAYSNNTISRTTEDVLISLKANLNDFGSHEVASRWFPKAESIQQLSKEAYNEIEKIKINLDNENEKIFVNDSSDIYEMLISYKKNVLLIDPTLTKEFEKKIRLFTESIDSIKGDQREVLKKYFDGVSLISKKAMLTKLQNNIRVNEEKMVIFCHEQINVHPICRLFSAIAILSSSIVQPGEQIEIYAGVGEFGSEMKAEVFVYERPVRMTENAVAIYKLKAASKPGKYYVPVKINYTNQDGKAVTVQKEVEYTVANIPKQ